MLVLATPPPPPPPPARILVFSDEFRFSLSRLVAPAGRLRLQLKNIGEDDHDLIVRGPRGALRGTTGVVPPGDLADATLRLAAGRYRFFCGVADHAARGMSVRFTVRPPKRGGG